MRSATRGGAIGLAVGAGLWVLAMSTLGCVGLAQDGSGCPQGRAELLLFSARTAPLALHVTLLAVPVVVGVALGILLARLKRAKVS